MSSFASSACCSLVGLLLLTLTSVKVQVKADVCAQYANGCSIPFGLDYFYKDLFTSSCYRHDVCYRCGVDYGENREACDKAFLSDMKQACEDRLGRRRRRHILHALQSRSPARVKRLFGSVFDTLIKTSSQVACEAVAYQYFLGVRAAGASSYKNPALSYCSEPDVPSCLP